MDKEQALAVIKQGMSTEMWGQRFYQACEAQTVAEDGRKVFSTLVVEEGKHLDILRGQYAAMAGSGEWLSVPEALALAVSVGRTEVFPDASGTEQVIPEIASDDQALQLAMDFERRGYELYAKYAKEATSAESRAMWEFLAKAEDLHFKFLADTSEYLATNGTWYFDAREFPIFEG
jgi:rubrerythrin